MVVRCASVALLLLSSGCGHFWGRVRNHIVLDRKVEVAMPASSEFSRARLSQFWEPASKKEPEQTSLFLEVDDRPDRSSRKIPRVDSSGPSILLIKADVGTPEADELTDGDLVLLPAPDGHALLVSWDGGKRFHYVNLELGEPIYCPHLLFEGAHPEFAPTLGVLANDILSQPQAHPVAPPFEAAARNEVRAALRYVAVRDDDSLLDTWAAWLIRPDTPVGVDELAPVKKPLGERAPLAQRLLLGGIEPGGAPMDKQHLAARALATSSRVEVQAELARLLDTGRPGASIDSICSLRNEIAESLARITATRAQASTAVLDALQRNVIGDPCTGRDQLSYVGVWSVLALSTLNNQPEAHDALMQAASQPCDSPLPLMISPSKWTAKMAQSSAQPGCWARAALFVAENH
jgi:hypothetical protein